MIYISAVGMINALGNNLDEIATNLTRGVAPGMRPRAGWLQGHPQAVLAGVDGELPLIPEKFAAHRSRNNQILLAALAQLQPQVDDAIAKYGRERIAIVLGTSTSGLHEGDTHVNLRTHGQPAPHGTTRNRNSAIRRVFSATGWRSTARPIPFQPPALPAPER